MQYKTDILTNSQNSPQSTGCRELEQYTKKLLSFEFLSTYQKERENAPTPTPAKLSR